MGMETCKELKTIEYMQKDIKEINDGMKEMRKDIAAGLTKVEIENRLEAQEKRIEKVEKEVNDMKISDADLRATIKSSFEKINEFIDEQKQEKIWLKRTVMGNFISYGINIIFLIVVVYIGLK